MNKLSRLTLAVLMSTCCALASADVLTFANFAPDIFSNLDTLHDGHAVVTVRGQGGFDGAIINGSDPTSCFIAVCPSGNSGNFFAGLNDGGMSFNLDNGKFNLGGLDFGFILPVDQELDFRVGQLVITADDNTTITRDFDLQDVNGNYLFAHWDIDAAFGMRRLNQVTIRACLFDGSGGCVNPAGNQAQFALDNLVFSNDIPEPGSLALIALSLGAMAAARRRARTRARRAA